MGGRCLHEVRGRQLATNDLAPMESLPKNLARDLKDIVGSKWVLTDRDRLLAYESDGLTAYRSIPLAVVLPESTSQVSNVFKLLSQNGIKVVPRGAGTGLSGGALAEPTSVIIGTSRMNTILELDADNRRAVVQPGVINAHLSEAAAPFGLYYAPDPASQSACKFRSRSHGHSAWYPCRCRR